jgi:cytochrome P450
VTRGVRSLGRHVAALARRFAPSARPAAPSVADLFDLTDSGATRPPFPALERLRADGPVHHLPRNGCWIVLGHDEARMALSEPELFSSAPLAEIDEVMLGADPPGHGRARRLVAAWLAAAGQPPFAARITAEAAAALGPSFDLVEDYAVPVARASAASLVGLEKQALDSILAAPDLAEPVGRLSDGLRDLLRRARLFQGLCGDTGGGLDEAQACSLVRLLCRASTETTERLIVRAAFALLDDAPLRGSVAHDPALLAAFLEEVMRLYPPEPNLVRQATRDCSLGGRTIPAGASVLVSLLGANRDPAVFPDPSRIRLDRTRTPHLAFGGGPHQCVGAGLARRISLIALQSLFDPGRPARAAQPLDSIEFTVNQGIETPRRLMMTA